VGPRAGMRTVKRRHLPALALVTILTELSGFPEQAQGLHQIILTKSVIPKLIS
jgi:hypothetical protein